MAILDYESDKDAWIDEGKAVGRAEGRAEGKAEGRAEGIAEGRVESLLDSVRSLMHKKGWSSDEAMDILSITPEERAIISARL